MLSRGKKILFIVLGTVVIVFVAVAIGLWMTSPQRTLNAFLSALEAKDQEKAMSYVSDTIKPGKQENIQWFVEDWIAAKTVTTAVTSDEAWRSQLLFTEENGEQIPQINKYGYQEKEIKPLPKYFAHHYHAFVTVGFDEFQDDVTIKLKRDANDTWSLFKQPFRKWKITGIKYQPFNEDDFEDLQLDEENGEANTGDVIDLTNDTVENPTDEDTNDETTTDFPNVNSGEENTNEVLQ
ncbi:MAG: hypothetical protein HYV32_02255 [Candidatus Kerfeldbacteria bacterium]|nr:hypothetical protein [Candidatus Kerfeldbacteria bacterium]